MTAGRIPEIFPSNLQMQNLAQNGGMSIWQRSGPTVNAIATSKYAADRFITFWNGSSVVINQSRQDLTRAERLVVGNGLTNYFRWAQTTAGSGSSFHVVAQYMENLKRFLGKTITLSFWAKADASRTLTTQFLKRFGDGGSAEEILTPTKAHSLTTSWQRFSQTITITDDDLKTFGPDNTSALRFAFYLPTNVLQTIDITGVMVTWGTEVVPFSSLGPDELVFLQRYYEKSYDLETIPGTNIFIGPVSGVIGSTGNRATGCTYKAKKRAIPTLAIYSNNGTLNALEVYGGTTQAVGGIEAQGTNGFATLIGAFTAGYTCFYYFTADADFY